MIKSNIATMPAYFDRYINYVPDVDILTALQQYGVPYLEMESEKLIRLGHQVYMPGKWTIPDILQHIIDTERIFSYRALRFARRDNVALPGFDENLFAANAHGSDREVNDLLQEFSTVRSGTIQMFKSFNEDDWLQEGISSEKQLSVLAIGFTLAGHVLHHIHVIKERYYPLLQN